MTGYWNTVGSTTILVATMGSSSVVTEGASTAGGVVSKALVGDRCRIHPITTAARDYLDKAKYAYRAGNRLQEELPRKFRRTMAATTVRNIIDWDKFYGIGSNVIIIDPSGIEYEARMGIP